MPNIIVSTFGNTWAIAAELVAFYTYPEMDVLENNDSLKKYQSTLSKADNRCLDEIWLICTHGEKTDSALVEFERWLELIELSSPLIIRYLSLDKLNDLTNEQECNQMSDFIYRVVLKANECKADGKLILSLTGGRKTMSSDMQRASDLFGCDELIHIADNGSQLKIAEDFTGVLDEETANKLFFVGVMRNRAYSFITESVPALLTVNYPVEFSRENIPSLSLFSEINNRLKSSESIYYNAYKARNGKNLQSLFHGLQQLSPGILTRLESEKPTREWIKALPKTDLHCHFGGILDVKGLIKTAQANESLINTGISQNTNFAGWLLEIQLAINNRNDDVLLPYFLNKEKLRKETFCELPKPAVVAAFIKAFEQHADYLEYMIYGSNLEKEIFRNIEFNRYEQLGDLQGSALLQSEASIVAACGYLSDYCREQNITYLELRCSPCNYILGGLTEEDVVNIMHEEFSKNKSCDIRIIIIGSRHGDLEVFKRHVKLAQKLLRGKKYRNFLVGFDIAGNEEKATPAQLREMLLPLMKECLHLTIHAGETMPVESIWEAVYELNTDRVGHGLTLVENDELLKRFRDRNIVIELCPSSNFQICDYSEKVYPLRKYLNEGLKVTLNTDNPGISRTTITDEYVFMTEYAELSKTEVLQLLRNSFQGVFLPKDEKKQLLVRTEEEIYKLLTQHSTT